MDILFSLLSTSQSLHIHYITFKKQFRCSSQTWKPLTQNLYSVAVVHGVKRARHIISESFSIHWHNLLILGLRRPYFHSTRSYPSHYLSPPTAFRSKSLVSMHDQTRMFHKLYNFSNYLACDGFYNFLVHIRVILLQLTFTLLFYTSQVITAATYA